MGAHRYRQPEAAVALCFRTGMYAEGKRAHDRLGHSQPGKGPAWVWQGRRGNPVAQSRFIPLLWRRAGKDPHPPTRLAGQAAQHMLPGVLAQPHPQPPRTPHPPPPPYHASHAPSPRRRPQHPSSPRRRRRCHSTNQSRSRCPLLRARVAALEPGRAGPAARFPQSARSAHVAGRGRRAEDRIRRGRAARQSKPFF